MKRIVAALFFVACVGRCVTTYAADPQTSPRLIVDVDVNDEVWFRNHNMTEADVKTLVMRLKQAGCQTLLIRCGCMGVLPYRTALSYPRAFDAEDAKANYVPFIGDLNAFITQRSAWEKKYAEVVRDTNPVEVFFRAGHEQGMEVLAWIDIFDDYMPGYRSKFLVEHPHCQWVGKDGKTYFKGLTDYSWPEAREFRVKQVRELLDLGADGIHCSTSAHCRHLPNTHEIDFYGYSEPIVKAFKKKYGVDILTAKTFDKAAWHDLKGEAMVQLYRDLAKVCHDRNKKLWIGLQLGRYTQFSVDPHFSAFVVARYSNHWKELVNERIADAFILGDYELVSDLKCKTWNAKPDIRRRNGEDLFAWAAREYRAYCKGKADLHLFYNESIPPGRAAFASSLRSWADITRKHGFDGIDLHEAWNFENDDPVNMPLLGEMAKRLREKTQLP